jgi:hypothetical protein
MDTIPFFIVLFFHVVSFITGFGAVIVIDTFGLLWLAKKVELKQVTKVASVTQGLIWLGWTGLVVTGTYLLIQKGTVSNLTMIKLFFVAMLGFNGILLHRLKKVMDVYAEKNDVPDLYKFRIGLSSFMSQLGWWGALIIGYSNRHWVSKIPGPQYPWLWMVIIAAFIGAVAIIGQIMFGSKNKSNE